jgi:Tfp pilus assembly PilM family ATPase
MARSVPDIDERKGRIRMSVSLYFSPTHLKLTVGSGDRGGFKIDDFGMYDLPDGAMINGIITDEENLTRFLADVGSSLGILKQDARLVIANNSIRSKIMDVPIVNEQKTLEFIGRELGAVDGTEEEDVYDYAVLIPKLPGGGTRILAVAVGKSMLLSYRNALTGAGWNLKVIGIGMGAEIRLASILPQLSTGSCILTEIDGKNLRLTLFENGNYLITNKHRLLNAEDTSEWISEIGNHIGSMIQFHKSQRTDFEITNSYFTGITTVQTAQFATALAYLGVHISDLDLADKVKLTGKAAAEKQSGFDPGKYLLNLGMLLKK